MGYSRAILAEVSPQAPASAPPNPQSSRSGFRFHSLFSSGGRVKYVCPKDHEILTVNNIGFPWGNQEICPTTSIVCSSSFGPRTVDVGRFQENSRARVFLVRWNSQWLVSILIRSNNAACLFRVRPSKVISAAQERERQVEEKARSLMVSLKNPQTKSEQLDQPSRSVLMGEGCSYLRYHYMLQSYCGGELVLGERTRAHGVVV